MDMFCFNFHLLLIFLLNYVAEIMPFALPHFRIARNSPANTLKKAGDGIRTHDQQLGRL